MFIQSGNLAGNWHLSGELLLDKGRGGVQKLCSRIMGLPRHTQVPVQDSWIMLRLR
jgi:hypothetical protein